MRDSDRKGERGGCRPLLRLALPGLLLLGGTTLPRLSIATAKDTRRAAATPEPADALRREQIPDRAMTIAGGGDARRVPSEVVAILGDGAWKHWICPHFGHSENPTGEAVTFSADGRVLVTQAGDTAKLWSVAGGRLLRTFACHGFWREDSPARFSPDGRMLATMYWNDVFLWDLSTGKKLHHFEGVGYEEKAFSLRFSPEGKRLTVISSNDEIYEGFNDWSESVWDVTTGALLSSESIEPIKSPKVDKRTWTTPDGRWQVSVDRKEASIVVRDARRRAEWLRCPGRQALVSPDGKTLAANVRGHVELWDLVRRQRVHEGRGHTECCTACRFSPHGALLVSSDTRGTIKIWQVDTGRQLRSIDAHPRRINAMAFSPDGRTLASGASDGTFRTWDVASGQGIKTVEVRGRSKCIGALAFSPDGRTLAVALDEGFEGVSLWDTDTWQLQGEIPGRHGASAGGSLAFSPDGRRLAGGRTWATVWDVATGQRLWPWRPRDPLATYVAYSPDGKTILTAHYEFGGARLWDAPSGRPLRTFGNTDSRTGACSVAFHPGGHCVAAAWEDAVIRVFGVADGKLLKTIRLTKDGGAVPALSFSPTGRHLATANGNGTVYILRL